MIIGNVLDDLGARLNTIKGLHVHDFESDDINVPTAMISLPNNIDMLRTYARGMDSLALEVFVLVSSTEDRVRRNKITPYGDGSGQFSIKQLLENGEYSSFDTLAVSKARFNVIRIAGINYLAIIFDISITGSGT